MNRFKNPGENILRIASFDVAKINFGQWIEDIPISKLRNLKEKYRNLPTRFQRRVRGDMNSNVTKIFEELFKAGKRVHIGVYDFRNNKDEKPKLTYQMRKNFIAHLRGLDFLWRTCDIFIIENQYSGGRKRKGNTDAIRVAEALFIWILENYPFKEILYFSSSYKTQILGAPPKLSDKQRKKWAIEKAEEIHKLRNDLDMLEIHELKKRIYRKRLNSESKIQSFLEGFEQKSDDLRWLADKIVRERQKLDDFSDAFLQLQAYLYKTFVACF